MTVPPTQGVQRRLVLVVNFFEFLKSSFWLVAAICDLVHDVVAIHEPSGNLF